MRDTTSQTIVFYITATFPKCPYQSGDLLPQNVPNRQTIYPSSPNLFLIANQRVKATFGIFPENHTNLCHSTLGRGDRNTFHAEDVEKEPEGAGFHSILSFSS